jgi:polyferredoxin
MECIACGLCVDACDEVMTKINKPIGLIRYDTEKNIKNPNKKNSFKIFKARSVWYCSILLITISITTFSLINKDKLQSSVIANRNPAYILMSDGSIRNSYQMRIINKTHQAMKIKISLFEEEENFFSLKINNYDQNLIEVKADSVKTLNLFITKDSKQNQQSDEKFSQRLIKLKIDDEISKISNELSAVFINP